MNNLVSLRTAMLAGAAAVAVMATPAAAQSIRFDIPAQNLSNALQQFALRTNREILFSPDLVAELRTTGLSGSYSAEEALRRLLSGTNLTYRQTAPNVFVIQRDPNGGRPTATRTSMSAAQTQAQLPPTPPPPPVPVAQASGETGAISGVVFDGATGSPRAGAAIRIEGTNFSAVSDDRGVYRFPALPPGNYNLVLDYLGEAPQTEPVTLSAGESVQLNFTFGRDPNQIVVYGYSSAIQSALNQQRTALNNATVVSEDLLGGFPAETVSEAMRRVPGVAFGRDAASGEGSRITVRGFSSEAINVQINGLDLQGTNFERTIDLSGYLAENISTITIHKTLLPSHQSTGSGGFVQIETRSGLDYGDFHISGSIEGERALADGFGNEWQGNATIGARLTSNFGIAGTVSYRDTNRRNYDVTTLANTPAVIPAGFTSVLNVPASQQFPFDAEFVNQLVTSGSYTARDRDETTLAASINLAWDIGDHTRLRLDLQRNERNVTLFTSRTGVGFLPLTTVDMPVEELGGEVRRRIVLNSFRPNIAFNFSDQELTTNTISLRGDTTLGRWQFRYKAGYSGALQRSDNSAANLLGATLTNIRDLIDPSTLQVQLDDDAARTPRVVDGAFILNANGVPVPSLSAAGIAALNDPANYTVNSASRQLTDSPTDSWIAEGSARFSPGSWLQYVETGFRFDRVKRSAADAIFATNSIGSLRNYLSYVPISGRPTSVNDLDPSLVVPLSLSDIGLSFALPSLTAAGNDAFFSALDNFLTDDPGTPFNEARFTLNDLRNADPVNNPSALSPAGSVETRWAGYLEAHLQFGQFELVGGARVERTKRTASAISLPSITLPVGTEPRETFIDAGLIDLVDTVAIDTTVSPTVILNWRPASNIVARFGYNRSTVAPQLQALRRQPQYFINLRNNTATVREGNPDLRPTTTDNFDFDVAYYFRGNPGLIRAGVFYKKTSNNFTNLLLQDQPAQIREQVLEFFAPLVTTRPELFDFDDDTQFFLQRPINGEGGVIWGFELEAIRRFDFLPGFLSGFGAIANLTYTSGDFPTLVSGRTDDGVLTNFSLDRPLEDQAAWVYNVALTYQSGGFEGRLIYTRQTETVVTYEIHDLNSIIPAYSTLDLRMSYNFRGPGGGLFTVFVEGDDLLRDADDPDIRSALSNTPGREDAQFFFPNSFQFNGGRTFTLGVRARF